MFIENLISSDNYEYEFIYKDFRLLIKLNETEEMHLLKIKLCLRTSTRMKSKMLRILCFLLLVFSIAGFRAINTANFKLPTKLASTWIRTTKYKRAKVATSDFQGDFDEMYFHPYIETRLESPVVSKMQPLLIPMSIQGDAIWPYSNSKMQVQDMEFRQLVQTDKSGYIGQLFCDGKRVALVGTLAKIRQSEFLENGTVVLSADSIGRFYVGSFPEGFKYGNVKLLVDYVQDMSNAAILEDLVFSALAKLLDAIVSTSQFKLPISFDIIKKKHRAHVGGDFRQAFPLGDEVEIERLSQFSFLVASFVNMEPQKKLSILQETWIEKRLSMLLEIINTAYGYYEATLKRINLSIPNAAVGSDYIKDNDNAVDLSNIGTKGVPFKLSPYD